MNVGSLPLESLADFSAIGFETRSGAASAVAGSFFVGSRRALPLPVIRSNSDGPRFLPLPPAFSILATRNGSAFFSSPAAGVSPGVTGGTGMKLTPPVAGLAVGADWVAVSGSEGPDATVSGRS